jgi:hypothetical protein
VLAATALAAALAALLGPGIWRRRGGAAVTRSVIPRQWLWFLWPAWPLALWTLWRWRHYLATGTWRCRWWSWCGAGGQSGHGRLRPGADAGLPGMAVLAAFALPTLRRSASAAIDWFSMFFFTGAAITIWVLYSAMQTGVPAKPAANIVRWRRASCPASHPLALAAPLAGTLAWLWLLRWRTGRHREALWKSLVLPAGGVALCWLLTMTLLAAAAGLRAQQPPAGGAHRRSMCRAGLHRRPGATGAGGGARVHWAAGGWTPGQRCRRPLLMTYLLRVTRVRTCRHRRTGLGSWRPTCAGPPTATSARWSTAAAAEP